MIPQDLLAWLAIIALTASAGLTAVALYLKGRLDGYKAGFDRGIAFARASITMSRTSQKANP